MKSYLLVCALLIAVSSPTSAQRQHGAATAPAEQPARLIADLGAFRFPAATANAEAQKFFDQGVILVYGFNHDEAARSFRRAAELDPQMPFAHWGLALALGPNYNETSISAERLKAAYDAVQRGLALAAKGPEHERAYLEALSKRFSTDALAYDEPPGWYHPLSRESLGGALMLDGQFAEAERVFRADLEYNRRNGRSLFGLAESLRAQGRAREAELVRREFERAWRYADTQLKISDL